MDAQRKPLKALRLRSYLIALVLAAALPAFMTAGLAVWRAAESYREASRERLLETARALARAMESELENRGTLARTLATAPAMGDMQAAAMLAWLERAQLTTQAQVVVEPLSVLTSDTGTGFTPAGIPRAVALQAARSGQPSLSNLYMAAADGSPRVAQTVAYQPLGQPSWLLSLVTEPQQLVRAAQAANTATQDTSLLMAVTDGEGRIVARSREQERFIGRKVPDWQRLQDMGTAQGLFEATTAEGGKVVFAFQTLRNTPGWVVVAGEPLQSFNARWIRPLGEMVAWGGAAVVLALLLARWLTGQVLRPVRQLADNARRVNIPTLSGTSLPETPAAMLRIQELEALRENIASADDTLRRRAESEQRSMQSLAASERRYRAIANAGALVLWSHDATGVIRSVTGWKALTGQDEEVGLQGNWIEHIHPDDHAPLREARKQAASPPYRADLEIRIRVADGSWRWVRVRSAPVIGTDGQVEEWIGVMEDVDERRQAQARITHMAHHDALTGLANRLSFRQQVELALHRAQRGQQQAVLYIDLDRFKEVNDTLGHPVGDALLLAVTERLKSLVRSADTVARLGGDEFVIAQAQVREPADAADLATRIVQALGAPYELAGQVVQIGASVGVHLVTAEDVDADEVIKKADMALYRAKEEGKGRYRFFEPEMDTLMRERRRTEMELRRALAEHELEMRYQPLVNVRSRTPSGLQSRLYWQHPERGELMVRDIIPLAAGMGLLVDIGQWILDHACADVAGWPEVPRVAVKISNTHLHNRNFSAHVRRALDLSGLDPHRLELEISESGLLQNPEGTTRVLAGLRGLGVRIVMDEFGSGDSALGCLRDFAFDKVKIASSLVRDVGVRKEGDAIVRALAALCDSMGIMTAVEGVENEAQFRILSDEECTEVQGSLFGGYRRAVDVPSMYSNWQHRPEGAARSQGAADDSGRMGLHPR